MVESVHSRLVTLRSASASIPATLSGERHRRSLRQDQSPLDQRSGGKNEPEDHGGYRPRLCPRGSPTGRRLQRFPTLDNFGNLWTDPAT